MKDSVNQVKLLLLVVLLLPILLIISEDIENITFPSIERHDPLAVYDIWDEDGKRYIDYVGTWGPAILGHAHPEVISAIQQVVTDGTSFGAPTEKEIILVGCFH